MDIIDIANYNEPLKHIVGENTVTPELIGFFDEVKSNKSLQKQLYYTKELSDVAMVANKLGFNITAAEVLRAQAGRLLELLETDVKEVAIAAAGEKPNKVAQWGREGRGYLEKAGYWLIRLSQWGYKIEDINKDITDFFENINKRKLFYDEVFVCSTFNEIEEVAKENQFKITATALIHYQALCITKLEDQHAELVAHGKIDCG
ncbi:Nif11-like leader peptide family natural product precursor [Piscirickettsia litoralis]|uniref:Nif11 domain-containing protein n=1 Tax=Piscirickettsia litoralis TaxID=1891921 RepID=A0ABX3A222_9GAMM|nr:Nif11-like leader peptide family natural product precursor [Piscirickettsia litoralis]ODN42912.1 hypothetical protein BGC07_08215 [Piscirickettsia litoralis]